MTYADMFTDMERNDPCWNVWALNSGYTGADLLWLHIMMDRTTAGRGPGPDDATSGMLEGYKDLIAKARRDAARIDSEWRVRDLATACTPEDVKAFLEAVK